MQIEFNKATDFVQIIAPASAMDNFESIIDDAKSILQKQGFKVKINSALVNRKKLAFYANDLQNRAADLLEALRDPQVRIIWALRGGYGSSEVAHQMIPELIDAPIIYPKILIGFSDITALHIFFNQHYLLPSIHANNINGIVANPETLEPIIDILRGEHTHIPLESLNQKAKNIKKLQGVIVGGNLTVLQSLMSTKLNPNFDDKILIIEDIGEHGYKIMRILMQMHYAGLFEKLQAAILGDFIKSDLYLHDTLEYFFQHICLKPAFKIQGFGHGDINIPVTLGSQAIVHEGFMSVYSPFMLK